MIVILDKATWWRRKAYLRTLKQKMGEPLGGAIFEKNDQYKYQNNQWLIPQRLVGVRNHTGNTSGLESKIIFRYFTLFWKVTLGRKLSVLAKNLVNDVKWVRLSEFTKKKFRNFPPTQNVFFSIWWLTYDSISLKLNRNFKILQEKNDKKISCRAIKVGQKLDNFY